MLQVKELLPGIGLTFLLTLLANLVISLPLLSVMGAMVIAILLGIGWRSLWGLPDTAQAGVGFAAKKLLRFGIILMGVRLNIGEVIAAGPKIILLDMIVITLAISVIYWLGRRFGVGRRLALLTGAGTGICGAAAIAAVAPTLDANEEETAIAVATIAILGTIWTIAYTLLWNMADFSSYFYGVFTGATLHEVAHVVAAAQAGGVVASKIAILTKLGRVALLIPVALILGFFFNRNSQGTKNLPIPWFILGFLGVSAINSLGLLSPGLAEGTLKISVFILTMAMAGLGLNVEINSFRRIGAKSLLIGVIGSVILSIVGFGLVVGLGF